MPNTLYMYFFWLSKAVSRLFSWDLHIALKVLPNGKGLYKPPVKKKPYPTEK